MNLLCDGNVARRYVDAFARADGITVRTITEALSGDADDSEIADYAAENDLVVLTEDDDFLALDADCGVVLYHQTEMPPPERVVAATREIATGYHDPDEIREYVPGEWA